MDNNLEQLMFDAARGLTDVSTSDLMKLLGALHGGHLSFPLTITDLTRVGLQHCATRLLQELREVDERGARATVVCVIAERRVRDAEGRDSG